MLVKSEEEYYEGQVQTDQPNLRIIVSGPIPPNPSDLLGSERMHHLMKHVSLDSDLVIVDSPPVLAVSDAAIMSTMSDGVVLVVDLDQTKKRDLRRARESIEAVGGRILGVVINRLSVSGTGYYYYQYGYQQTYGGDGTGTSRRPPRSERKRRRSAEPADLDQQVMAE
jgi:capsular exopolysaccharide synthesis family protein